MEILGFTRILIRWIWLIILIVGGTLAAIYFIDSQGSETYVADVTIQVTTPDREDIAVFDQYSYTSNRDEIINTVNKFIEVAQAGEVYERTLDELGEAHIYSVEAESEFGADLVHLFITADTPELAAQIANIHARQTIEHFGELRGRALDEALVYFASEMEAAKQDIDEAEAALLDFQLEQGIVSITDELNIQNEVLETLEVARAQVQFGSITANINQPPTNNTDDSSSTVDNLLKERRQNLTEIALLEPRYNLLVTDVINARNKYNIVADKYIETELKKSFAQEVFFIQIIREATPPEEAASGLSRLLLFGGISSFVLAGILVFSFEYLRVSRQQAL